jgi:transposase
MTWPSKELTSMQREERRLKAGQLFLTTNLSQATIARIIRISRTAATKWKQQIKQRRHGLAGLKNRPQPGHPPRLTAQQPRESLRWLNRCAQAFGFETARWTPGRVQQLIKQEYGVIYNAKCLSDKLRRLGWSPLRPAVYAEMRHARAAAQLSHRSAARAALYWRPKVSTTRSVRQRNV